MRNKYSQLIPAICLIIAMLVWSSSFIALKISIDVYDPMIVIFGRMLVGSFCCLFLYREFRKLNFRKKDIKYLLLMAVFEPCIYFIFEARALQLTTVSQAGTIIAILPLLVAIAARIFLKEFISRQAILGFVLEFRFSYTLYSTLYSILQEKPSQLAKVTSVSKLGGLQHQYKWKKTA